MSKRNNKLLINDIVTACSKILIYTNNISYDEFLIDDKTKDACVRNFEIIGEATNNLSNEFVISHNQIEWKKLIGLRNRLVHAYFGVDYEIMWKIIEENIEILKLQLTDIYNSIK